jgi:enhancing lycopene biosynthesis protein 2
VNCLTGKPAAGEKRNQQVESARIARGLVEPLSKLKASDFNALIIPGGFGAAQNLCSFAHKGSSGEVQEDLKHALQGFHAAGKPIGAVCIAPAVVALAFPKKGFELTVGEACEASQEIEKLGHRHFVTKAKEWHTDTKNKIVSTPAYMFDTAPLHEIFEGIRGLVRDVLKLT